MNHYVGGLEVGCCAELTIEENNKLQNGCIAIDQEQYRCSREALFPYPLHLLRKCQDCRPYMSEKSNAVDV